MIHLKMADNHLDHSMFMYYTYSSHHIHLTNTCTKLWNSLLKVQKKTVPQPTNLHPLPELCPADSHKRFGLIKMSAETTMQYSLAMIKQEPGDDTLNLSLPELLDANHILQAIGVDPSLINMPAIEPPKNPAPDADTKGKGASTSSLLLLYNYSCSLPLQVK